MMYLRDWEWSRVVVGYVLGASVPFQVMKQFLAEKWREFGNVECVLLKTGIYVFHFETEVLDQSPWPFKSKMLFLKAWTPELDLSREDFSIVPVWIKLPDLE
ncbi:hypothetical protein ACH5RR_023334 [Cinchona calisaya]|uniref:DUF4283 domain-containing protein n=1 Tax=Cinchona calisaya TaxID=153742 RepID=A0ABD2ZAD2_9GENT